MRRQKQFFVVTAIVLSICGFTCAATYGGGSGTLSDPYQIWTPQQMNTIGLNPADWTSHFKLMDNINMSAYTGTQYNIIGNSTTKFTGTFNGNNHIISNLTYTTSAATEMAGLFGMLYMASVYDLTLQNVNISTDGTSVGALAGYQDDSSVSNCSASGTVHCNSSGSAYAGGLVGYQRYGSTTDSYSSVNTSAVGQGNEVSAGGLTGLLYRGSIEDCHSSGQVSTDSSIYGRAGGLVGSQLGPVQRCYSTGTVTCNSSGAAWTACAGGLSGYQYSATSTLVAVLSDCYSTGCVTCSSNHLAFAGGLVGQQRFYSSIDNCYSTGNVSCSSSDSASSAVAGGLVGHQSDASARFCYSTGQVHTSGAATQWAGGCVGYGGMVINCYWDIETSGITSSAGGWGKTTAEMKQWSTYPGWNSVPEMHWTIQDGIDYPRLTWQGGSGTPLGTQTLADYLDGAGTTEDPYLVSTALEVSMIRLFPASWSGSFILQNDIDLQSGPAHDFNRIGIDDEYAFAGTFDGAGHAIKNFHFVGTAAPVNLGFFGYTSGAVIKDLSLTDVVIDTYGWGIGSLIAGQVGGTTENCFVSGTITASAVSNVGGLCAVIAGGSSVSNCHAEMTIDCSRYSAEDTSFMVGGLISEQEYQTNVVNCSTGGLVDAELTASEKSSVAIGGICGRSRGTIKKCFSTMQLNSHSITSGATAGGIAAGFYGESMEDCYATGQTDASTLSINNAAIAGGLIGSVSESTVIRRCFAAGAVNASGANLYEGGVAGTRSTNACFDGCFWNTETCGTIRGVGNYSSLTGVAGITTAQMMTLATFTGAGWDFSSTDGDAADWMMLRQLEDYPRLAWQTVYSGDIAGLYGVDIVDFLEIADNWLETGCPAGCEQADINISGKVDLADFAIVATQWLKE